VLEHAETEKMVRYVLDRLSKRERTALTAKYVEGLSAEAIGQQMNTTAKAVHSLLHRAKLSFRQQLQQLASANKE
jgi:RNA polymerase sigma factor (sigma-70 family)